MADYKAMYLALFRARWTCSSPPNVKCEELYLSSPDPELRILELPKEEDR